MRRVLACLCVSLVCASCSEESSSAASPTLIPVGGSVEPQVGTPASDVAVDAFWAKVREASAAYPASSKTKLTHVAQTPTGPVVVEEEVVMSEYMRIWQEEDQNRLVQSAEDATASGPEYVKPASTTLRKPQHYDPSKQPRPAFERSYDEQISKAESELEASKRRRGALEAEIEVERQRENREWVIQELEAGIKSEREAEAELEAKLKRLDEVGNSIPGRNKTVILKSKREPGMPFGRSSFGPWDTGSGLTDR